MVGIVDKNRSRNKANQSSVKYNFYLASCQEDLGINQNPLDLGLNKNKAL